jgi:hypothetical protein
MKLVCSPEREFRDNALSIPELTLRATTWSHTRPVSSARAHSGQPFARASFAAAVQS